MIFGAEFIYLYNMILSLLIALALGTSAAEYINAGRDLWMLRQDLYVRLLVLVAKLY